MNNSKNAKCKADDEPMPAFVRPYFRTLPSVAIATRLSLHNSDSSENY